MARAFGLVHPSELLDMDHLRTDRSLVIKVKYGDTLRRFGARVCGDTMDHDIAKLKAKIINLFRFNPNAELILTYIDEDGDVVTLNDDYELHDAAISQRLDPLRIDVVLKTTATGKSDIKSEPEGSTSTRSPQIEVQKHQISSAVNEALKSCPEPLRGSLSKITNDFVSKAAFIELFEYFSKLGLSNITQTSQGESSGAATATSTWPMDLNFCAESKVANDPIPAPAELRSTNCVNPFPEGGFITFRDWISAPVGLQASGCNPACEPLVPILTTNNVEVEKKLDSHLKGKAVVCAADVSAPPVVQSLDHNSQHCETPILYAPSCDHTVVSDADSSKQCPTGMKPYTSQVAINSQGGLTKHVDTPQPDVPVSSRAVPSMHPFMRTRSFQHNTLRTLRRGVWCDGCGMHIIMGPRFKSKVKEDYDLCSYCFAKMGSEAEYLRIDQAPYRSSRHFKESYNSHSRHRLSSLHGFHAGRMRPSKAKFESRFIQDITVLDGTIVPPATSFTKIWRMLNNGTIAWPRGTQLVWIGGDQLGNQGSVELEIPINGCAVDEDVDIAVDFTSPSRPGRYISYWKMASPSGQKFGQRVWVLIQVGSSRPNSAGNFHPDINLNLPPECIGWNGHRIIDINAEPLDGVCPVTNMTEEFVKPFVDEVPFQNVEPASVDVLLGANGGVTQPMQAVGSSTSYPIIDLPEALPSSPNAVCRSVPVPDDDIVEDTLLKELEEMGFKLIDLNKEILRLNEYDLEQSVDDLCEWDPLLCELQEMGFNYKEMSKKILIKKGGSIKHVVSDLIAGEKA